MAKTTMFNEPYKGRVEHPRGMFWDRTEEGVRLTKVTGSGQMLFTVDYDYTDFAYICAMMTAEYVAPPEPKPEPEPEPIPDPAPRAIGGTPDTGPAKVDAPKAPRGTPER